MQEVKLYRKNVTGIGTWRIWHDGSTIHIAHATAIDGAEVFHTDEVFTNQSGRSIDEQIQLEIDSRVSKALDKGYKRTLEEAKKGQTNQLGLVRPMLAKKFEDFKSLDYSNYLAQPKLDGHRCLVTKTLDGDMIAYSRQGKQITTIDKILLELEPLLPREMTIDGELYCHGQSLQTLSSWIKRKQENTDKLIYNIYDEVSKEDYLKRFDNLMYHFNIETKKRFCIVPSFKVENLEAVRTKFQIFRREGYEGLILRDMLSPYEDGKRSKGLIKVKQFLDEEFLVVDIAASRDGWAVLTCVTSEGKTFSCSAPGNMLEKREVLENRDKYLGRLVTVEFANWTKDKVPFHPNALRWREDV